ncbi:class I adenylate-forming enzyme family protein [Pseudonocardia xishanensis]|uniref:AMP-binding protein n=1 Tax=Pseudonocardia xishanensis TaxID=630995 RepID=A0ABP8RTE9_9PSEU
MTAAGTRAVRPVGLPESLTYPALPIGAVVLGAAERYGDRAAFVSDEEVTTFAQLGARSRAFAAALAASGVEPGDVVAVHLPNRPEYAVAYYGLLLAGAVFSPVNPLLPDDALGRQLVDSGAVAVVTSDTGADAVRRSGAPDVRLVIQVGGELRTGVVGYEELVADDAAILPEVPTDVDRIAHIAYTGGTTGVSKGVELTHRNVVSNILQFGCWIHGSVPEERDGTVWLDQVGTPEEFPVRLGTGVTVNLSPWYHAMGCVGSMNVPVLAGVTTVLQHRFEPAAFLEAAERHGATSLSGAPTLFAALLDHPDTATRDLSTVRLVSSGAAPLSQHHVNRLRERFPGVVVVEGYGLTEATMGVSYGPTSRSSERKVGSVGVPVFDTEVELRDPDTLVPVADGERGEVWIRGPQVMQGYRNRPDDTADVLRDGWLRTGDVAVRDADGHLFIVDRTKDMLIYKGYNVYPREIEELLARRPDVAAAAVVGRPNPDVGDLPVAFVVPRGARALDTDALMAEVNGELAPYKKIREVHVVESLPVSGAGKILKRELRERLTA